MFILNIIGGKEVSLAVKLDFLRFLKKWFQQLNKKEQDDLVTLQISLKTIIN